MKLNKLSIPGCYEIIPEVYKDERGSFVKTFNKNIFLDNNLETNFVETYHTISRQRVLRGLHFQTPPKQYTKLVYCISGEVIDAIVDLRRSSPTYGKFETINLSDKKANILYIPAGIAHGFYVTSKNAILIYNVTSAHSPENDSGILWNSVGIPWPDDTPIISKRDKGFLPFSEFKTPFVFNGEDNRE